MSPDSTPVKIDALMHRDADAATDIPSDAEAPLRGGTLLILDFGLHGNSASCRTFGWSGQEESYIWSIHGSSGLRLPPAMATTSLHVVIDFAICTFASLVTTAVVRVFANGNLIGSACAHGRTRMHCTIPEGLLQGGEPIDLRFEHPCFVRPDFIEGSRDDRPLGLCVYSVSVYPPSFGRVAEILLPHPEDCRVIHAIPPLPGRSVAAEENATYRFGASGDSLSVLDENWLLDEDGYTYSSERVSSVRIKAPPAGGRYLARISLCALYMRNRLPVQRVSIIFNGAVIGHYFIASDTILTIPLPPELVDDAEILNFAFFSPDGFPNRGFAGCAAISFVSFSIDFLTIECLPTCLPEGFHLRGDDAENAIAVAVSNRFQDEPDASLPDAIASAVGASLPEFLKRFESVGDNCFFGGAQRSAGADVLGLLRFANAPIRSLLDALSNDLEALRDPANLTMRLWAYEPEEYFIHLDRYGIRWHTGAFKNAEEQPDLESVFRLHATRLTYLRRKFDETLRSGRKIFILVRADLREWPSPFPENDDFAFFREPREPLRLAEVLSVFLELNRHARNTILYITETAEGRLPGTVELIAPGIMRGYVSNLKVSPELSDIEYAAWLRVAANAWLLDKGPNAAFRNKPAS
nr:hypothetical protein [uncultured Rhodopila sp.]